MRYALFTALLLVLAACDADPVEDDAPEIAEVLFTDVAGDVVAYSHGDHWHGTVRTTAGQTTTLDAWLVMEEHEDHDHEDHDDDHDHGDHGVPEENRWARPSAMGMTLRITSDNEAVASWTGTGDVVTLASAESGAALTTVVVLDGSTTVYQSPSVGTISDPAATARLAQ
jgi:hypothetical protein